MCDTSHMRPPRLRYRCSGRPARRILTLGPDHAVRPSRARPHGQGADVAHERERRGVPAPRRSHCRAGRSGGCSSGEARAVTRRDTAVCGRLLAAVLRSLSAIRSKAGCGLRRRATFQPQVHTASRPCSRDGMEPISFEELTCLLSRPLRPATAEGCVSSRQESERVRCSSFEDQGRDSATRR
jgi:hypothetical protein